MPGPPEGSCGAEPRPRYGPFSSTSFGRPHGSDVWNRLPRLDLQLLDGASVELGTRPRGHGWTMSRGVGHGLLSACGVSVGLCPAWGVFAPYPACRVIAVCPVGGVTIGLSPMGVTVGLRPAEASRLDYVPPEASAFDYVPLDRARFRAGRRSMPEPRRHTEALGA